MEKIKKTAGLYGMVITALIGIALYIFLDDIILKLKISFLGVVLLYAFGSLYRSGIKGLMKSILNFSTYMIVTFATFKLANTYELPFLQTFIVAILGFSALYFYTRFPNKVVDWILKFCEVEEKKAPKDAITYEQFRGAQKFQKHLTRRNSFLSVNFKNKLYRIGFLILSLGLAGSFILQGEILLGIIWGVIGVSTLMYGTLSGIKSTIIVGLYTVLMYIMKDYMNMTPVNPLEYYLSVGGLTAIIITVFSIMIIRTYKKNSEYANVVSYKKDDSTYTCDMFPSILGPIYLYNKLFKITVDITKDEKTSFVTKLSILNNYLKNVQEKSSIYEYIFVGTIFDDKVLTLYVYVNSENEKNLEKYFKRFADGAPGEYKLEIIEDPKWKVYNEKLVPDKYVSQEIVNKNYIKILKKMDVREDIEHKILYFFNFKTKEAVDKFVELMKDKKYAVVSIDDFRNGKEKELLKGRNFGVILSATSRIGEQRMNIETRNLIDLAEENEGDFEGWTIESPENKLLKLKI